MAILRIKTVKSATLTETIVALTLIVFIFGLATSMFVKLIANSANARMLRAESLLDSYRASTHANATFYDEEIESDGIVIRRTITEKNENLVMIRYSASDETGLLEEFNELAMIDPAYEKN